MGVATWRWLPYGVGDRTMEAIKAGWSLGVLAFGGMGVNILVILAISSWTLLLLTALIVGQLHDKYVKKLKWIDEQMYQELFAISQAISGPASTKMLYVINLIHGGFIPALIMFLFWSLPGALGMYGLAVGVSNIGERLPRAVYALLSGLNAATVGIVAQAAVELSEKSITDQMTRILVLLGAMAGLVYTALWYFPLLMFLAGAAAVLYDFRIFHPAVKWIGRLGRKRNATPEDTQVEMGAIVTEPPSSNSRNEIQRISNEHTSAPSTPKQPSETATLPTTQTPSSTEEEARVIPADRTLDISWQFGTTLLVIFFASFILIMTLRGALPSKPLLFELFSNMFLAGTIIFGGGPVVIPLLREYVVTPGWVAPRDFLLGLAIIQAFPGPNFNFAVYLGGLTAVYAKSNVAIGSFIGYVGIFLPGMVLVHGTMGIWSVLRTRRWVKSGLRGVNAAAVGLIYTAVYRLWQIGYVDFGFETGKSLGDDPWWVVVGVTSFAGGRWFGLNAPSAIALGGVMGLIRYGVVSA